VNEYLQPYLSQKMFELNFQSPLGLAAGFDKNCELSSSIHKCGFGFAECGTVTPFPQEGNEKPRVFRLQKEEALINALGFNNDGIDKFLKNLAIAENKKIPVGINIGPNKKSINFLDDYIVLLDKIYEQSYLFDYITINISSPNTERLRNFHDEELLSDLLKKIDEKNKELSVKKNIQEIPVFLKISPDIDQDHDKIMSFLDIISKFNIKALIVGNTTIDRVGIDDKYTGYKGGLSGRPLFQKSTDLLKLIYSKLKDEDIKLIGVGGISSAEDAYKKIKAGASLIQLYTSMIYKGPFIANDINRGLVKLLQNDGFDNISEAIGVEAE
jgi:dihydroorotate dehydrogenase